MGRVARERGGLGREGAPASTQTLELTVALSEGGGPAGCVRCGEALGSAASEWAHSGTCSAACSAEICIWRLVSIRDLTSTWGVEQEYEGLLCLWERRWVTTPFVGGGRQERRMWLCFCCGRHVFAMEGNGDVCCSEGCLRTYKTRVKSVYRWMATVGEVCDCVGTRVMEMRIVGEEDHLVYMITGGGRLFFGEYCEEYVLSRFSAEEREVLLGQNCFSDDCSLHAERSTE